MKWHASTATAALILFGFGAAASAQTWIGAWGYTSMPLPPGVTPALAVPVTPPVFVPLGVNLPGPTAPRTINPQPPRLDNPANIPVENQGFGRQAAAEPANVTVRQIVRMATGGTRIRLRVSNEGGADAQILGAVHVAEAAPDHTVLPGTDHVVTFDGKQAVAIPAGAPLLSDPVDLPVKALEKLLISIHVPGPLTRGGHVLYQYVSGTPGDSTAQAQLPGVRIMRIGAIVTQVEVEPTTATNVVVTLGDSITEGGQSTSNAFRNWSDRLAERLNATPAGRKWSVVNAGIGGGRLLRYGTGPNALARLDRDVLAVPGIKAIILLEGVNDIGRGFSPPNSTEPVTAEALEAADKQIIARAHEHGVKVIGATLTPFGGAAYWASGGEKVREDLNTWIKTSGAFDGVADFGTATADPVKPDFFRADFNLGDHLHPDDAGHQAMADSIDLKLLTNIK